MEKDDHLIKQVAANKKTKKLKKGKDHQLKWWELSLIGIGSIIGAGYFLGTGLSIKTAGPSILFAYLIGGAAAFIVFGALAEMSVHDPDPSSFRGYAKKAYGHSFGFLSGWIYWVAGVLIMSSEITALSIFTQFWFPTIPLWVFAILYSLIAFGINLLGVKNFGKIESVFGIIKISALLAFILFGALFLFGAFSSDHSHSALLHKGNETLFPNGLMGFWNSLIFVFFSFGGIGVTGFLSSELKNKNDTPKAGSVMLITLTAIYMLSLLFVMTFIPWTDITQKESPFVTALSVFTIPYIDSIFNVILITAAFSTMAGALYAVTTVMVSLAKDGDAPKRFARTNKKGVPVPSLILSASGLAMSIIASYFLPDTVYEYLTTAAGILLILNWVIILASHIKNHPSYTFEKIKYKLFLYPLTSYLGIILIGAAISGSLFHANQRVGFFISLIIVGLILLGYFLAFGRKKKEARGRF